MNNSMDYNKLTKAELIRELQVRDDADRQDVLDEIKRKEEWTGEKYNFSNIEIDRIIKLYKMYWRNDTTWNDLIEKAINNVLDDRNTRYEVHILDKDGTTKDRYDFKKFNDAIEYYNTIDTDKKLVMNIADKDFDTLYRYYTDNKGYGVKTINYRYKEEE